VTLLREARPDQAMPKISQNIWRQTMRGVALSALLALCACGPHSTELEPRHDGVQMSAVPEHPASQMCRADNALLLPPRAPDCAFGRSELKTLDPDQWARLKVEYERKCYQNAEKSVREKLRLLQAANRCEANPARL
jgi:hypothetical protein